MGSRNQEEDLALKIGVLSIQGDVSEHVAALQTAAELEGIKADIIEVKTPEKILSVSALVLPGGESTTLGKLLAKTGCDKAIKKLHKKGAPIWGTCAGLILLAKEAENTEKGGQPLLKLLDAKVDRNAFGRQKESFEEEIVIPVLGKKPFHAVFIRAPAVERVWGDAEALASYGGFIVMVRQNNLLGTAFHPELTGDLRIHRLFLSQL
ncbi:Pyridoxal 5'-phosphate synthase subunit PdxT [uncultured archaeon]|nr:Pyridoxal 5'-phosphate synthase subunit PdxT [uncultured archaeon]